MTPCRRAGATSRHRCGSPNWFRSHAAGVLATLPTWFFIRLWFFVPAVFVLSVFCVASAHVWKMISSSPASTPLAVYSSCLPFSLRRRTFWSQFLRTLATVLFPCCWSRPGSLSICSSVEEPCFSFLSQGISGTKGWIRREEWWAPSTFFCRSLSRLFYSFSKEVSERDGWLSCARLLRHGSTLSSNSDIPKKS